MVASGAPTAAVVLSVVLMYNTIINSASGAPPAVILWYSYTAEYHKTGTATCGITTSLPTVTGYTTKHVVWLTIANQYFSSKLYTVFRVNMYVTTVPDGCSGIL